MEPQAWFIAGGCLLAVGAGFLLVTQILLLRWLKKWQKEGS